MISKEQLAIRFISGLNPQLQNMVNSIQPRFEKLVIQPWFMKSRMGFENLIISRARFPNYAHQTFFLP